MSTTIELKELHGAQSLSMFLFTNIEIGSMVLAIVELHDLCRYDRLQAVVVIRQVWQGVFQTVQAR